MNKQPAPIPIGLMTIINVDDFEFISWQKPPKRRDAKPQHKHKERMMAWRPRELHEFWRRMLGEEIKV